MAISNIPAKSYAPQSTNKSWIGNILSGALRGKSTPTATKAQAVETDASGGRVNEMAFLLKSIGPIYSTPFLLFYKGYEYSEIAAQLNLPVGTVKSRVFSARVKMKQLMAQRKAA